MGTTEPENIACIAANPGRAIESARRRLFQRFAELGIAAQTVPYPPARTIAEGKALRGQMAGQFTKNLLLRDKKGRLFLVVAAEDRVIDLKTLHIHIHASGRLGFAPPAEVQTVLGIEPGALTPLALINDTEVQVTIVIDAGLMGAEQLNFHPLVNTESTGIRPQDLAAFVESCDRSPVMIDFIARSGRTFEPPKSS